VHCTQTRCTISAASMYEKQSLRHEEPGAIVCERRMRTQADNVNEGECTRGSVRGDELISYAISGTTGSGEGVATSATFLAGSGKVYARIYLRNDLIHDEGFVSPRRRRPSLCATSSKGLRRVTRAHMPDTISLVSISETRDRLYAASKGSKENARTRSFASRSSRERLVEALVRKRRSFPHIGNSLGSARVRPIVRRSLVTDL
jgi:hypothetical protein